ncbi:hypothetical protein DPEC_G00202060 [Dallia pectoralis]|uniref:Uncharacterized protein n=1 Tax=Dallia pectoralis TaxID=75939 RepID=A0ACC2G9I2_DALPE|nr:hypothetical protein DPEC_G00202060 [Dallia pectoralis]
MSRSDSWRQGSNSRRQWGLCGIGAVYSRVSFMANGGVLCHSRASTAGVISGVAICLVDRRMGGSWDRPCKSMACPRISPYNFIGQGFSLGAYLSEGDRWPPAYLPLQLLLHRAWLKGPDELCSLEPVMIWFYSTGHPCLPTVVELTET